MWWLFIIVLNIHGELQIPVQNKYIRDIGFEYTQDLHNLFKKYPKINSILALGNSCILLSCDIIYIYDSITNGWTPLARGFTLLYTFRFIVGALTRLPKPKDIIEDNTEIPPANKNFFFLFSAHTMCIYLVGAHFAKNIVEISILTIIILLQSIRLLATRGHYTADIILALVLAHLTHIATHN